MSASNACTYLHQSSYTAYTIYNERVFELIEFINAEFDLELRMYSGRVIKLIRVGQSLTAILEVHLFLFSIIHGCICSHMNTLLRLCHEGDLIELEALLR